MRKNNQTTIVKPVKLSGVGIHSGRKVELIFKPAAANFGYAFCRTDLEGKPIIKLMLTQLLTPREVQIFKKME